jgi:hypothetical protein
VPLEPLPPPGTPGSIRGQIEVPAGVPFPSAWTLSIRPSRSLFSQGASAPQTLEFSGETRQFHIESLSAAGYDLFAEAPGLVSRVSPVLLSGHALHPFVVLRLDPTGFLEGDVVDAAGAAIQHLPVQLQRHGATVPVKTRTDALGRFYFEDVREGLYALRLGEGQNPMVQQRKLHFHPPSMRVPTFEVPLLGQLDVRVVDTALRPVEGARVQGSAKTGGYFDFHADAEGRGYAHLLPEGRYRIYAQHKTAGRGQATLELAPGERQELELILEPQRVRDAR